MPIDISDFQDATKHYYDIVAKYLPADVATHLKSGLNLPKDVTKVSTYADKNVDKQEMFETLQAKFMWNVRQSRRTAGDKKLLS